MNLLKRVKERIYQRKRKAIYEKMKERLSHKCIATIEELAGYLMEAYDIGQTITEDQISAGYILGYSGGRERMKYEVKKEFEKSREVWQKTIDSITEENTRLKIENMALKGENKVLTEKNLQNISDNS